MHRFTDDLFENPVKMLFGISRYLRQLSGGQIAADILMDIKMTSLMRETCCEFIAEKSINGQFYQHKQTNMNMQAALCSV